MASLSVTVCVPSDVRVPFSVTGLCWVLPGF